VIKETQALGMLGVLEMLGNVGNKELVTLVGSGWYWLEIIRNSWIQ
jgi:hypothetical protein